MNNLTRHAGRREHAMKVAIRATWCACFALLLAGCNGSQDAPQNQSQPQKRETPEKRQTSGEIFTRDSSTIIKQSGAMIYFLNSNERDSLDVLIKGWRSRQYENDRDSLNRDSKEYAELFDKHKRDDGKVYDPDVIETLNSVTRRMEDTKRRIESKEYDSRIDVDDPAVKGFLQSTHWTVADSEGRFSVILPLAQE